MIYFTADTHYGHGDIIPICKRPFKSINEMNKTMIRNYNSVVNEEDTCYFLGDFVFPQNIELVKRTLSKLKGTKHLILGNHDNLKPFDYIEYGFTSVHTSFEIQLSNLKIILVHDPALSCIDRESTFLGGHVHDLFKEMQNFINVGVDVRKFSPISLTDIIIKIHTRRVSLEIDEETDRLALASIEARKNKGKLL